MWIAMQSIVQPVHAEMKLSSHAWPIGAAPFVIAGEQSFALPAKGCMYVFHAAAASAGERLAWLERSGSLKLRGRC